MFRKIVHSTIVLCLLPLTLLSASTQAKEHHLTDEQLHAMMGIITNFILSDDPKEPLSISGVAKAFTHVYDDYYFKPTVKNVHSPITFSITHKPNWAEFNTTTGVLSGTPDDNALNENIVISVSDGKKTVSLASFDIVVRREIDIAYAFGTATQGESTGTGASKAIDASDSSRSEAYAEKTSKVVWWQVKLPSPTKIHKLRIKPIDTWYRDLFNSKIYLSNNAYNGTVDETTLIATLKGGASEKIFEYPEGKSGVYLIIRRDASTMSRSHQDTILNLASVEVYGNLPQTPKFVDEENTYLISGTSKSGDKIARVNALDYQEDAITYSINSEVPFSINSNGEISVNEDIKDGSSYTFDVIISDGINETTKTITVDVTALDSIGKVLKSGDILTSFVTEEELIQATIDELEKRKGDTIDYTLIGYVVKHFKNNDYHFDWSKCKSKPAYDMSCTLVPNLKTQFLNGTKQAKSIIDALDTKRIRIFSTDINTYRLEKLLVLLADKLRQSVIFPMDKIETDDNMYMRSFFADSIVYNYRDINPKQPDLGNFSRADFAHIVATTRQVKMQSRKSFRSTGAYALPGRTFKVTRHDNSAVKVKVFINSVKEGSVRQYSDYSYNRPKYLQSTSIEIKSGETIELTSPYGGPIQLRFYKNEEPVDITFEDVGEHAYWASAADDESFSEKLTANEFDWAEIATAGFEVHSKLNKMIESVNDDRWGGTAAGLAAAVVKYTSNYPHVLAGFKGEGVDIVPEIHDWAEDRGLTIESIDMVKHMNADQASCGYGCSGNPYDAFWAFDPIGHGDIHEMGHSMQKKRFEGFPNHAATNTFSYYTKSRYFENTGKENECGGLPFKSIYQTINAAVGQSNVSEYLKINLWDKASLGEQYALKIEAMMHAQKLGKLKNGWHVLARVHILEREMNRAKKDWESKKISVGFSSYTLDEINKISNNDWLIIAYSYAAGLDYRNYFDMMGIPFSQKAHDQIASFGFDVVSNALFISTDKGYCSKDTYGTLFDRQMIEINGTSSWPE